MRFHIRESYRNAEGTLTGRALLTFYVNLFIKITRYGINLIVIPVVLNGLGSHLFGVWQILNQTITYLSVADLRPTSAIKFALVKHQHNKDDLFKKRQVGAALAAWILVLPIIILIGISLVLYMPKITHTEANLSHVVMIATVIALITYLISNIMILPDAILRGMNLAYKGVGLNAITYIIIGILNIITIMLGWGLIGIAVASLIGILITGTVNYIIAWRWVPWFGVAIPKWQEITTLFKFSAWIVLSGLATQLVFSADIILIGWLLNPVEVTIFVISKIVMEQINSIIYNLISSSLGGFGDLFGREEWERIRLIKRHLQQFSIFCVSVIGSGVILLNRSFITLWIGEQQYAGNVINLLIVIASFEPLLNQVDSQIIDISQNIGKKTLLTLLAGIINVIGAIILIPRIGLVGMVISIIFSRFIYFISYVALITKFLNESIQQYISGTVRPLFISGLLYLSAYYLSPCIEPNNWLDFLCFAIFFGFIFLAIAWWGELTKQIRIEIIRKLPIIPGWFSNILMF